MLAVRLSVLVLVVGCVSSEAVPCGDHVCPPASTCDQETHLCIPENCGDGKIEGTEECDGANVAGLDCTTFGYYQSPGLACTKVCTLDESACVGRCGDGVKNGTELCDGAPPDRQTCLNYGFDVGRLSCNSACSPGFSSCTSIGWHSVGGPGTSALLGLWGSSETDVFAVGSYGEIWHSSGGAWTQMASPVTTNLQAVWGSGPTNVFAVGDGGVIVHYDGSTWTSMASPTTVALKAVWGRNASDVFAVGGDLADVGWVLHFDGANWTSEQVTTLPNTELRGVYGEGSVVYAVGRQQTILKKDGTGAWTADTAPTVTVQGNSITYSLNWVFAVSGRFIAVGQPFSAGLDAAVILINDDGAGWTSFDNTFRDELHVVWAASRGDVFVGGTFGALLRFDGTTLTPAFSHTTRLISGLWGTSHEHVLFSDVGGDVYATDGIEWTAVDQVGQGTLSDFWHYTNGTRTMPGQSGELWTVRGGVGQSVLLGASDLQCIWDTSTTEGAGDTFVGTQGDGIYHRPPGDPSSTPFSHLVSAGGLGNGVYKSIWGASSSDIYAVGGVIGNAQIRHWDGSGGWTAVTHPGGNVRYTSVWGSGPNDIFVGGTDGTILHSSGAGAAFTAMQNDAAPTSDLHALWGTGPADVYAVCDNGIILHYDGTAWRKMVSGGSDQLLALGGTGRHDIFAAGAGLLLHYDGVRWTPVALPVPMNVYGASVEQGEVTLVGAKGVAVTLQRSMLMTEQLCGDTWDNDWDTKVNCDDSDCASAPECAGGGVCAAAIELSCNTSIAGSTFSGISQIDEWPGLADATTGSERTYRIPAGSGAATVTLDDVAGDVKMFVVPANTATGACDFTKASPSTGSATVDASTQAVYVVVDSTSAAGATFTVNTTCP